MATGEGRWRSIPLLYSITSHGRKFYIARGFDPALTAFPAPAFLNGLKSAGLYEVPEQTDTDPEGDDTEAGFMRTNEAHDRLMRFEYRLRMFIDEAMTLAIGPDWIRHRVPEPIRKAWEERKIAASPLVSPNSP